MLEASVIEPAVIAEEDWPAVDLPPDDLPDSDGEPMESPWHRDAATLLKAGYIAARDGQMDDYFVGCNMFLYFSELQIQNRDFKGPDFFIVKGVDGTRRRRVWATWKEGGRYPDVIIELLSDTTEQEDLTDKKTLYERTFRTTEYFCLAPDMARMIGWRYTADGYRPIVPNDRRWLFSEQLNLWLGIWHGTYLALEATWPRWYSKSGDLILLPEESERQRANAAEERATAAEERAAQLAARLRELGIDPD